MTIPIRVEDKRYFVGASVFYVAPFDLGTRKIPGLCRLRLPGSGQVVSSDELRALADKLEEVFGRYTMGPGYHPSDADETPYEYPTSESYGGTE